MPDRRLVEAYRFGPFRLELKTVQLRKHGARVRLSKQPFLTLKYLIENSGRLVTREDLRSRLWGEQTFVGFEDSLNHAIKRVRDALMDSAQDPTYLETEPGVGYRFVADVETVYVDEESTEDGVEAAAAAPARPRLLAWRAAAVVACALTLLGLRFFSDSEPRADTLGIGLVRPAIVVLPLVSLSSESSREFMADGMTEALTAELGKIGALRVISRTSANRYRGSTKPLADIASELGVAYLVEGSVLYDGEQVRISVQLVEATQDRQLWAESYSSSADASIAVQARVAREVADAIQVEVTPDEESRIAAARPVSPEVMAVYVSGRRSFEAGHTEQAIKSFQRAIELDPNFALPYSWLADTYASIGWWTGPATDFAMQARVAAMRSRDIDDSLAEPYRLLGRLQAFYEWDWDDAERYFERALELNPNHAPTYVAYGQYLLVTNRTEEALELAAQALEIDPMSTPTLGYAADAFYFAKDYDRAIRLYETALTIEPEGPLWHAMLGCVYTEAGQFGRAISHLQQARDYVQDDVRPIAILAWSYARSGQVDKARALLRDLEQRSPPMNASDYSRAFVYASVGEMDRAFEMLDEAVEAGWPFLPLITQLPPFAQMRADPRFDGILSRIGLIKYWR